ncbi:MAG: hypothetical protein ABL956_00965 [Hyphomonadaceae bacterium]
MLKWTFAVALAAAAAGPAFAQKTDLPDRPLKQTKAFDGAAISEGIAAVKQSGECTVTYIMGVNGKAKDIKPECTVADMAPYAVRVIESGEWEAEITGGEFFDSFPRKQILQFTANTVAAAASPNGEKAPVLVTDISPNDVKSAISMTNKAGRCNVVFTVGTDGSPKDIKPTARPANSTPASALRSRR